MSCGCPPITASGGASPPGRSRSPHHRQVEGKTLIHRKRSPFPARGRLSPHHRLWRSFPTKGKPDPLITAKWKAKPSSTASGPPSPQGEGCPPITASGGASPPRGSLIPSSVAEGGTCVQQKAARYPYTHKEAFNNNSTQQKSMVQKEKSLYHALFIAVTAELTRRCGSTGLS